MKPETVSTQVQDVSKMPETPNEGKSPYQPVMRRNKDGKLEKVVGLWLRKDRYYAQLRVTTSSGTRIPKKIALPETASTLPQAIEAMEKLKADISKKEESEQYGGKQSIPSFGEYMEHYFERAKHHKSAGSLANEKSFLLDWECHLGTDTKIDRIREAHIEDFLTLERTKLNERTGKPLTNHTLNLKVYALRSMLRMAMEERKISRLPFVGIKKLKYKPKRKVLPPASDIEKVINGALEHCPRSGPAFADYVRILMLTGCREQEALNLQWSDIDFEGRRVHFHRGTKFGKERFVDFNPRLEGQLKSMLLRRNISSPWLFPSPRPNDEGGRVTNYRQTLEKVRDKTGVYLSEHYLRHYFTSQAVMAGVERFQLVKWLGHADGGKLIAEVYGHLSNEFGLKEAQKLVNL